MLELAVVAVAVVAVAEVVVVVVVVVWREQRMVAFIKMIMMMTLTNTIVARYKTEGGPTLLVRCHSPVAEHVD
jgi:hypothetical protein